MPPQNCKLEVRDDLRLYGDKIELTTRPIENLGRASARGALLGAHVRPMSVVPILELYKMKEIEHLVKKRPLSATIPLHCNFSITSKSSEKQTSSSSNDEECEPDSESDKDSSCPSLESMKLFKSLVEEPINSWRCGVRTLPRKKKLKKPAVVVSVLSKSDTSSSTENSERNNDTAGDPLPLIPGLTTKPPLPKRPPRERKTTGEMDFASHDISLIVEEEEDANEQPVKEERNELKIIKIDEETIAKEHAYANWFAEVDQSEQSTDRAFQTLRQQQHQLHNNVAAKRKIIKQPAKFRGKFVANQIPCLPDEVNTVRINENIKTLVSFGTQDDTHTSPKSTSNYTACLNQIEQLQTLESNNNDNVVIELEQEAAFHSEVGDTYKEILSMFAVLQDQDKKSQASVNSIKEIVNNEVFNMNPTDTKEKSVESESISTFDEIVSLLNVMDTEEISPSSLNINCTNQATHVKSDISNTRSCVELKNSVKSDHITFREEEDDEHEQKTLNSSANLNDIFTFLDQVDKNCMKDFNCGKDIQLQKSESGICLNTVPKFDELISCPSKDLAQQIIDLNLRLKDKSSSIGLLQNELSSLRQQVTKMTKDADDATKDKLKMQKQEYETVVKRHQKFIDQLIADKKTLNKQCESLLHEIKMLENRYNSNMQAMEHRHRIEVQKLKDMHTTSEKMRRERWIDSKTQKIKEMTVKGLEPELDKMSSRHQQEMSDLRNLHKREIEDLELRAARKTQQQCEAIREQLTAEREQIIAHERELLRHRHEQMVALEEQNYQDQRRKLLSDHAARIAECEEREKIAIVERDKRIKMVGDEFNQKLEEAVRRQNNEIKVLKEQMEVEMETFRNNYKKQMIAQIADKETLIKEKCRKERDQEIETVIERLETEANDIKSQIEESCENRIRRLKAKYELEIKELETAERAASNKYSEVKTKLLENEDQVITLKATIKQLESQLQETRDHLDKLIDERKRMQSIVREEMKHEVVSLENEVQLLKSDKEKELQQVYSRVRLAVARKDEALSEITRDYAALQEKCTYLESMLEQQRKEYLIKS